MIEYKAKFALLAQKAITKIFKQEFKNSLGIPNPNLNFVLPDEFSYDTGLYYIDIQDKWQINLNFGKLPQRTDEFLREVAVLTRHEIGHYMCCPYDLITHLRMINTVNLTYKEEFSHLNLNMLELAGGIANQVADIIVDTNNFLRHPTDTKESEISWISKGAKKISNMSDKHARLMFLTKERIWEVDLGLNEADEDLISVADYLAKEFVAGGVTNRLKFLQKTKMYTRVFLELLDDDIRINSSVEKSDTDDEGDGECSSKNGLDSSVNVIYQATSDIESVLEEFAKETSLDEYLLGIKAAHLKVSETETAKKVWFDAQSAKEIPLDVKINNAGKSFVSYPLTWRINDPIEDLNFNLSLAISPILIPGVTTKKRVKPPSKEFGLQITYPDLLILLDTSGSMGELENCEANMHQAVLASFGVVNYFESKSSEIALIGFADRLSIFVSWTKDYQTIKAKMMINGSGGTNLPISRIDDTVKLKRKQILCVLITDGEIDNIKPALNNFIEFLAKGNLLNIFLLNKDISKLSLPELSIHGAKVIHASNADQIRETVINGL